MTNTDNFEAGLEYHQATKTLFILTPAFSTTTLSIFSRAHTGDNSARESVISQLLGPIVPATVAIEQSCSEHLLKACQG
jgi:hypothetical protein